MPWKEACDRCTWPPCMHSDNAHVAVPLTHTPGRAWSLSLGPCTSRYSGQGPGQASPPAGHPVHHLAQRSLCPPAVAQLHTSLRWSMPQWPTPCCCTGLACCMCSRTTRRMPRFDAAGPRSDAAELWGHGRPGDEPCSAIGNCCWLVLVLVGSRSNMWVIRNIPHDAHMGARAIELALAAEMG